MSLINDALQDIELRRGEATHTVRTVETNPSVPKEETSFLKWISFVSVICIMLLASYFYGARESSIPVEVVEKPVTIPDKVIVSTAEHETQDTPETLSDTTSTLSPLRLLEAPKVSGVTPHQDNPSELINEYLKKIDDAIVRNRLSVPAENNALYFIGEILALDPHHSGAIEKQKIVRKLYVEQVENALTSRNIGRANTLLNRHQVFEIEQPQIVQLLDELERIKTDQITEKPPIDSDAVLANREKTSQWVASTDESKDLQQREKARRLFKNGESLKAVSELRAFVEASPSATHSIVFLFDHYIKNSQLDDANLLIGMLPPDQEALGYMNAHMANIYHGPSRALEILEASIPPKRLESIYLGFMAGLYQKQRDYGKSKDMYRRLLVSDRSNSKFLLGYAISTDSLGEVNLAINAYEALLKQGHDNPTVSAFVENRIIELRNQQLAGASQW